MVGLGWVAVPVGLGVLPVQAGRILGGVLITRRWAGFLVLVGVWTWVIWPRFAVAILRDDRSFAGGTPTSFLWVHALLISASLVIGTAVGVLGVRAWRAASRGRTGPGAERLTGVPARSPKD